MYRKEDDLPSAVSLNYHVYSMTGGANTKITEGVSPVNSEFSSASLSDTDIALPNSEQVG